MSHQAHSGWYHIKPHALQQDSCWLSMARVRRKLPCCAHLQIKFAATSTIPSPDSRPSTSASGYCSLPMESTLTKASWGTSTLPNTFMRFLPSACFFSSFFLRLTSPP